MLGQLTQKRRLFMDKIRQHSLQQQFSQMRAMLSLPSLEQAKDRLPQALRSIKSAIENNQQYNLHGLLMQVRVIAQNYNIAQCLSSSTFFPVDMAEVRSGVLPLQCTWVQIFTYLLNKSEETKIQIELLKIMHNVYYQIRVSVVKLKQLGIRILTELLNNLPFGLCGHKNYQVRLQLCYLFGQALVTAELLNIQRSLLDEPSYIIRFLETILSDGEFFRMPEGRLIFIDVGLLIISMESNCSAPYKYIEELKSFICSLILQNFNFQIQTQSNFEHIKVFVLKGGQLEHNQINYLQKMMHQAYQHPKYYQALNCILRFHNYTLQLNSLKVLLSFILNQNSQEKSSQLQAIEMKKWMILILQHHLCTKDYQWSTQQYQYIENALIKNSFSIHEVLLDIRKQDQLSYQILASMLQSFRFIANNQPVSGKSDWNPKILGSQVHYQKQDQ